MKHLKLYEQFVEEGLIKTVDVDKFISRINDMMQQKGYLHFLDDSRVDKDGHVWLMINMEEEGDKQIELTKDLISLINILGYYVSHATLKGEEIADQERVPKNNDNFLMVMKNAKADKRVQAVQVLFEPKFEQKSRGAATLYHITEERHLEKIMKIGLVPKSKSKVTYHPERIYLCNKAAMAAIYGKYRQYVKTPVILQVSTKGLTLYPDINAGAGAYWTSENISPDRIKVLETTPKEFIDKYLKITKTDPRSSYKAELPKESWENVLLNFLEQRKTAA